jgi:hypothetical protein
VEVAGLPLLSDIPVSFPGAGSFTITFPIAEGDSGIVIWCNTDLEKWLGSDVTGDPGEIEHSLNDCIFIPGVRHEQNKLTEIKTDAIVIGKQGDIGVRVDAGTVELGVANTDTATESAVLGDTLNSALSTYHDNIKSAIDAILLTGMTSMGPVTFSAGTAAFTAAMAAAQSALINAVWRSTKVKVK